MEDCKIWDSYIWSNGRYGMDKINGKSMGAHRAEWIRKNGDIPEGMVVCHKCDNGLCVNVNHLFLGSLRDNMQDCLNKKRLSNGNQKGENNNNSKFSTSDYIKIKKDRQNGMTYSQLKYKYHIKSNGHLKNILDYNI